MFKNIVWATDGSEQADLALAVACTMVNDAGGRLHVVHCEQLFPPDGHSESFPTQVDEEEMKAKIRRQVAELVDEGIEAELHVAASSAGAALAIADIAREEDADVIIVGTRGHTPMVGMMLGSVTQRLLHVTPCPVLAVPGADRDAGI